MLLLVNVLRKAINTHQFSLLCGQDKCTLSRLNSSQTRSYLIAFFKRQKNYITIFYQSQISATKTN